MAERSDLQLLTCTTHPAVQMGADFSAAHFVDEISALINKSLVAVPSRGRGAHRLFGLSHPVCAAARNAQRAGLSGERPQT